MSNNLLRDFEILRLRDSLMHKKININYPFLEIFEFRSNVTPYKFFRQILVNPICLIIKLIRHSKSPLPAIPIRNPM